MQETLVLFNSFTKKQENFIPYNKKIIKLYSCGPTVYSKAHIGNSRSAVVYDLLYRILLNQFQNCKIEYVRNITDIDDKIINKSIETGRSIDDITKEAIGFFHADMEYLNCLSPTTEPRATENIDVIIEMINILLQNKIAYQVDNGDVFFNISKYDEYYNLSGRNSEHNIDNVRLDKNHSKQNDADFILWKTTKTEEKSLNGASFDSPFGVGRPGWHIECSAMIKKYLGSDIDIHGGGCDLLFPHHTNEIAQTKCAYPDENFVKYWVHNGFLTHNGEKMSKSIGNVIITSDVKEINIAGDSVRLFLLSKNYRKPIDYTEKAIDDSSKMIRSWYDNLYNIKELLDENNIKINNMQDIDLCRNITLPQDFISALCDDLNTPKAISILHQYSKNIKLAQDAEEKLLFAKYLINGANFLGVLSKDFDDFYQKKYDDLSVNVDKIEKLIIERNQYKQEKKWQMADKIRDELLNDYGVILEDKIDGKTSWQLKK